MTHSLLGERQNDPQVVGWEEGSEEENKVNNKMAARNSELSRKDRSEMEADSSEPVGVKKTQKTKKL